MTRIFTPDGTLNPAALQQQAIQQQMMAMRMDDMYVRAATEMMASFVAAAVPHAIESGDQINYAWLAGEAITATNVLMDQLGIKVRPRVQQAPASSTRTMHDPPEEPQEEAPEGDAPPEYVKQD